jgi:hypothetical protein
MPSPAATAGALAADPVTVATAAIQVTASAAINATPTSIIRPPLGSALTNSPARRDHLMSAPPRRAHS